MIESGWVRLWLLLGAAVLIVGAFFAFSVDCSVAQWFHECHKLKNLRYLRDLASICEIFGRAECALLVAILMWRLDRSRHWAIPGVVATALLSGLAADGVKMLIARARPHSFDFLGSVWSSFGPWLPLGSLGSASQSFPIGAHGHRRGPGGIAGMHLSGRTRPVLCFAALGCFSAGGQRSAFPQRRSLRGGRGMSRGGPDPVVPLARPAKCRVVLGTRGSNLLAIALASCVHVGQVFNLSKWDRFPTCRFVNRAGEFQLWRQPFGAIGARTILPAVTGIRTAPRLADAISSSVRAASLAPKSTVLSKNRFVPSHLEQLPPTDWRRSNASGSKARH